MPSEPAVVPSPSAAAGDKEPIWDFENSFPSPLDEAIEEGVIREEDVNPECLKAIHEEHACEMLMVLHEMRVVLDARRRGVYPHTDLPPKTPASAERLSKFLATEPVNLLAYWKGLMGAYESAFGGPATRAFGKWVGKHYRLSLHDEPEVKSESAKPTPVQPNASGQMELDWGSG